MQSLRSQLIQCVQSVIMSSENDIIPPTIFLSFAQIYFIRFMHAATITTQNPESYICLFVVRFFLSSHCVRIYLQTLRQAEQKITVKHSYYYWSFIYLSTRNENHTQQRETAKCFRKSSRGHVTRAASNYHYRMHSRRIFFSPLSSFSFPSPFNSWERHVLRWN